MKIAVVDDELHSRKEILEILLQNYKMEELCCYENIKDLLASEIRYDLLLLDIELNDVNGIDFVKEHYKRFPSVIFVTAYDSYVLKNAAMNISNSH